LRRIASYGYTIMAPWRITSANYTVDWIDPTIDYAVENMKMYLNAAGSYIEFFTAEISTFLPIDNCFLCVI
jgi:hypothetical protein